MCTLRRLRFLRGLWLQRWEPRKGERRGHREPRRQLRQREAIGRFEPRWER